MKMHVDYEWSKRQLNRIENEECSAGVPVEVLVKMGPLSPDVRVAGHQAEVVPFKGALGKFIRMLRRRDGLSLEAVARKAEVELTELIRIEQEEGYKPRPRTVVQLARLFSVPEDELAKLAGLKIEEDPTFQDATLKFAAHSEDLPKLSKVERDALNEYLAFLTRKKKNEDEWPQK
jgi:HTH-type transcriptional regulator, competence development regulator